MPASTAGDPALDFARFLERIRATHAIDVGLAVDLGDGIAAAERVRILLQAMASTDWKLPEDRQRALAAAGEINALIESELLPHFGAAAAAWPHLLEFMVREDQP